MPKKTSSVHQLQAVAAGLCRDAGIHIDVSKGYWAWDPVRKILFVNENDLHDRGVSCCAGLLAHEIGHFFLSRYHHFHYRNHLPEKIRFDLLNSLEDPRVERWIQLRYRGVTPWFAEVFQEYRETILPEYLPDVLAFELEAIKEVTNAWVPAKVGTIKPAVAKALQVTRDARKRYINTVPPPDMNTRAVEYDVDHFYREHVWPDLIDGKKIVALTREEKLVQCSAWQAFQVADLEIFPVIQGLLTEDEKRLAIQLDQNRDALLRAQQVLAGMADALTDFLESLGKFIEQKNGGEISAEAQRLAKKIIEMTGEQLVPGPIIQGDSTPYPTLDSTPGRSSGRAMPATRSLLDRPKTTSSPLSIPPRASTTYEREYPLLLPAIDLLLHHMEEVLLPAKRMAERSGYATGSRLNLRRLMAFSSDARQYNKLWTRKNLPDRRNTAFSLLVDLSGSMKGEKSVAAMHGSILVAEVLNRLVIPFEINGFNDEIRPMKRFDQSFGQNVQVQLASIPEISNSEWNDDGPCLAEASDQLLEISATDHIMVVISDGRPEGLRSDEQDLCDIIATLSDEPSLVLIGIGIGPDTEHVSDYYPESIANVGINAFPDALGQLLQRLILARFE